MKTWEQFVESNGIDDLFEKYPGVLSKTLQASVYATTVTIPDHLGMTAADKYAMLTAMKDHGLISRDFQLLTPAGIAIAKRILS